jgi:amidohydrolase
MFRQDLPHLLDTIYDPMIELRHDLHAHPELSFDEHRTTSVISQRLVDLGWELRTCPTSTGVVARLTGGLPGQRVMVRADIDALPVHEERQLSFASRNDNVMHACGHDVHTASLLGVADILSRRRDDLTGEITLLFQPAEEVIGGARAMIDGGVLDDNQVDYVVGAHVTSLLPVGVVATKPGILMSEACTISVHLSGRGGHGAMSQDQGNVVLAVSHLAPRLSEVVEGLEFEGINCACSAGVVSAGTASNVVPRHAMLHGTLRTFSPTQQEVALQRLAALLTQVEQRFEVRCELRRDESTPAVDNDPGVVRSVLASAADLLGSANVLTAPPVTPSDDVSEFLRRVPGCYILAGGALADGTSGMHHSPDFAVDDSACRIIAGVLASSAVRLAAPTNHST